MTDLTDSSQWPPMAREIADLVAGLAEDRAYARRRDLRPENFPRRAVPTLYLVDVIGDEPPFHGPWEYRFRLLGQKIIAMTGANWTGMRIDRDLVGERLPIFYEAYDAVLKSRRMTVTPHRFINIHSRLSCPALRFLFPLSEDGQRIDALLGYMEILSEDYSV